ncbi:UV radiation resistance-associated protein, partial [Fasciolopsis buskii]
CSSNGQVTSPNCDSVLTDRFSKLWDSHEALITQDLDTDSAAISLGLVAHLLCLVSAILNLPIRHPFDLSEGYSRSTVVDQITPELADTARVFPLYLLRSSLVPSYRHAIVLFHRNLIALRSLVGLPTSSEPTVMGNLRNLLQYCLSSD